MDLSQLLSQLLGSFPALTGPYGLLIGAGILLAVQWAKAKWPNLKLPDLRPGPKPAPSPNPGPEPGPLSDRPVLDLLLKLLGGKAVPILANAVQEHYTAPPEDAKPVK